MREFLRELWSIFWLIFWLLMGTAALILVLRFLDTEEGRLLFDGLLGQLATIDSFETAVRVIGGIFGITWGLRLLDRVPFRGRIANRFGLRPNSPSLVNFLTFSFVHRDETHLAGNTRPLLLFAGVNVLMVPSLEAFLVGTVVMILVLWVGLIFFSFRTPMVLGASGILLGYYSFDLVYGIFARGAGGSITAGILLLLFGRFAWRALRLRGDDISHIGHWWGFLGGVAGAFALMWMGYYPVS